MSIPSQGRGSKGHPGRSIGILFIAIVALFAIAFVQGATSVKLGLDLRGGTSVTLQPRIAPGENGKVTSEAIDQAVGIIRQRVNSLGVAEAEVASQGSGVNRQIVISVPGETGRRVVELVGQTAELRFRQVLAEGAANATSLSSDTTTATLPAGITADVATKFASLDCSIATNRQTTGGDDAASTIVACDRAGINKYVLAPAEVVGRDVSKAAAAIDQQGAAGWYVLLNFNNEGTSKFGALTTRVTGLATPQNQVAIVLDGLVVSAPRINEAITAGNAQITGSFTQTDATDLANVLKYGALPLAFDRGEVQQISPTLGSDQLHAEIGRAHV